MKQLYYNGTFITVNDAQPLAEALMVENGKIVAIGSLEEVQAFRDETTDLIDLAGKTVVPGFVDGHGHIGNPAGGIPKLYPTPNGDINSKERLLEEMRRLVEAGEILENGWFVAIGYDNAFFENSAHPNRKELDAISTDIPMIVLHISGHVAAVNSKALEIVGWTKDTPNPEGGIIQRDPITGELTGVVEEKAVKAITYRHVLKGLDEDSQARIFEKTQDFYLSRGVTTAQDGGIINKGLLDVLEYCQAQERIKIDVGAYPLMEQIPETITDYSSRQRYVNHLKIAGAKVVGDGSPQAKTAWLTAPYYVKPDKAEEGYKGYPVYTDEQLLAFCREALTHNWQMLVHCNGDAMSDQFIRCYRKAIEETGNTTPLRPVMIHAQTVREDQLDAMKELGIMPSFFNDHVFYWGDYHYESVLGPERANRISPLASAVKRGIPFTLHNDMPVTPINPIFCIHNAVNRVTRNGRLLGPEYAVDVMEALKAVTIYGAYQFFDDDIKGSLEVGKLADMVILDKNLLTVPKEQIKDIKVLETIKEGESLYKLQ